VTGSSVVIGSTIDIHHRCVQPKGIVVTFRANVFHYEILSNGMLIFNQIK